MEKAVAEACSLRLEGKQQPGLVQPLEILGLILRVS
jgi:hypothetical protein